MSNRNGENIVAAFLKIISWIIYLGGLIAGFALGNVESSYGYGTEFSFALALTYWVAAFISGTVFLGFAEIINLLQQLLDKNRSTEISNENESTFNRNDKKNDSALLPPLPYQQHEPELVENYKIIEGDITSYLNASGNYAQNGNFEDAANILEDALSKNPEWSFKIAGVPCETAYTQSSPVSGYALLTHLASNSNNKLLALQYIKRMFELSTKDRRNGRQAAREAGLEQEAKELSKEMGISWPWLED